MRLTRRTPCPPSRVRHLVALVVLLTVAAVSVGCGGSGSSAQAGGQTATPSTTSDPSSPVGVIAIGHSGLTGENSDPDQPGAPIPENSWATGTSPKVDSVYTRMVAARPETENHVASGAAGGAPVTALADQATVALELVPEPQLIIIQTIDNDIRCDGTDARNVTAFGATVKRVLTSLTTATPASEILMVGQLGRPSPAFIRRVVAAHPDVKSALTGSGICDFYDEHGTLNAKSFARLTAIIDAYEAEQARVCARFPRCHTDGGVRAKYQDTLANFSSDLNHLNVRGQAEEAALIWPVVAQILGVG
jgi:hypothetical protein